MTTPLAIRRPRQLMRPHKQVRASRGIRLTPNPKAQHYRIIHPRPQLDRNLELVLDQAQLHTYPAAPFLDSSTRPRRPRPALKVTGVTAAGACLARVAAAVRDNAMRSSNNSDSATHFIKMRTAQRQSALIAAQPPARSTRPGSAAYPHARTRQEGEQCPTDRRSGGRTSRGRNTHAHIPIGGATPPRGSTARTAERKRNRHDV